MAERGVNPSIDWAVTEPAASRMLEAVRAVRRLKYILTGEERRCFDGVYGNECSERSTASDTVGAVMEIEEPGTTCVTLGIFLRKKSVDESRQVENESLRIRITAVFGA